MTPTQHRHPRQVALTLDTLGMAIALPSRIEHL